MTECMHMYKWIAVSSNNIFWNASDKPLRVIQVPDSADEKYLTIINPKIIGRGGKKIQSTERCGSFPGETYSVIRYSYAHLVGYVLHEGRYREIDLEYGYKSKFLSQKNISYLRTTILLQHETDHLNAKVLPDIGILL